MIELQIIDEKIRAHLSELVNRYKNLTPVMRRIAGTMHDAVEENLEQEGRPRWSPLKPSTIKERERTGHWPGKILQRSGQLGSSIAQKAGADFAKVTTNKVYAGTLHFGAKKGEYGKTKGGVPIPWGDIPARPFMMLTPKDKGYIEEDLINYLLRGR